MLQIILLITRRRSLGYMAELWQAEPEPGGWLTLQNRMSHPIPAGKPNDNNVPALAIKPDHAGKHEIAAENSGEIEIVPPPSYVEAINEIFSISRSFTDQEIHRRFGQKGLTVAGFLNRIPEALMADHIRPFVDRQLDKMFRLALLNDFRVCFNEGSPRIYPEGILRLNESAAEPWFCFTKRPDGSDYILEIYQNDIRIKLIDPSNAVIAGNPCWFKAGKQLLHFPEGFDGKKIQPFLNRESILIPTSAEKKYFETFILKTLKTGQVKAEGFSVQQLEPERKAELSVEVDWQGRAVMIVYFRYGEKRIMAGKSQKVFIDLKMEAGEVTFFKTERDFAWEDRIRDYCISLGFVLLNSSALGVPDPTGITNLDLYSIVERLNKHSDALIQAGIIVRMDRSPIGFFTGRVTADIDVLPGDDWFDVSAVIYFGDLQVPFGQLREYILNGIREFPLPSGEIVVLPGEWFTRFGDLFYYAVEHNRSFRVPVRHFGLVNDLMVSPNPSLMKKLEDLEFVPVAETISLPALKASLRPYQAEGLQWLRFLHSHGFGGCLADDMGLGKTIQTLALLLSERPDPHKATLIIMPASVIHNWRNETRRFAPSLRIMEHTGINRSASTIFFNAVDIILTTYGLARNDLGLLLRYHFHYVILDESQMIKNPLARVSRAVCQLKADHRVVLTGTPIENSLTDLWSQMEFLNPGLLGPLAGFQKRYRSVQEEIREFSVEQAEVEEGPEVTVNADGHGISHANLASGTDSGGDSSSDDHQDREERKNVVRTVTAESTGISEKLKRQISPFILRRTKREVEPDLPPLTIEEVICEMTDDQRQFYERERSAVRNEVLRRLDAAGSPESALTILKALIRLRQASSHPFLLDPGYSGGSGKLDEIIRTAITLQEEGHKTLIFSSFVKHLQIIADRLSASGISFTLLTGATVRREQVVNQFKKDEVSFFLISLKAGGTGLNLTKADYVMILDPWWNPAAELQAINRAHRIGQDKKVIAYKYISADTIEEKIIRLQTQKQRLTNTFVPSGNPLKDMTREEIRELFAGGR